MDNVVGSRDWVVDILKHENHVKITHRSFEKDEYLYGLNGLVYDELGYLFENWDEDDDYHNGMRIRSGGCWDKGWRLYEE